MTEKRRRKDGNRGKKVAKETEDEKRGKQELGTSSSVVSGCGSK